MTGKLDFSHKFTKRTRVCSQKLYLGVGGSGREGARTGFLQEEGAHGIPCPYSMIAEVDLCAETGRGIEPSFVPANPGALARLIFPGVNCSAIVREHGGNPDHPLWEVVDSEQIESIQDTGELGGYANPPVARAVQEFLCEQTDEFVRRIAKQVESMRRATFAEWEPIGPFHLHVYASPCGAVGSTALHLVDKLRPLLKPPVRVLFTWLLLADGGRVTDRNVAMALQHAALTEVLHRTRGCDE